MVAVNSQSSIVNSQLPALRVLPLQDAERDVLSPADRPALIDWLKNNYMLVGGSAAVEGLWSAEYTPYFVPVAEWLGDTTTREVWVFACAQSGKTTFGTGWHGYIVDNSPGPMALVMPDKESARERVETRFRPMYKANEDLLRHVQGGRVNNIFIGKPTTMDNLIFYLAWATTAQALADRPICFIHADETGKYPAFVGAEADPISLMRKRQRWFKGRSKLFGTTTPVTAGDLSDEQFAAGDQCEWWVPCVHCDSWHQMAWEHVQIDRMDNKTWYAISAYERGGRSRYVCPKCGSCWSEDDRWRAVKAGKFVPAGCSLDDAGRVVGSAEPGPIRSCRIHALMLHPMVETVKSLTVEFVKAQNAKAAGNIQPLKDFWNSQLARCWKEDRATTEIEVLRRHIGKYENMKVPPGVMMITAGMDVQLDHVWFKAVGFGYLGEYWTIYEQRVETGPTDRVENLKKLLPYIAMRFELMSDPDKVMRIAAAAIDRQYNSETVDALCVYAAATAPVIAVMGDDKLSRQSWAVSKSAGGVLAVYRLNVTMYKDALYRGYFESTVAGPGYGHLHSGTEQVTLEHLTSEKKIIERKGERITWIGWVPKSGNRANHLWDCDVYARAAADIAGLWTLADPSAQKKEFIPAGKPAKHKAIRTRY